jgi:hypothetical protein
VRDAEAATPQVGFYEWFWATSALALTFVLIEPVFHRCGHLDSSCYLNDTILVPSLLHSKSVLVIGLWVLGFAIWQCRLTWQDLGLVASQLRLPAIAIVFSLGWALSTAEPNYWWGNSFWIDRLLLVGLGLLTLFRPAFIGAFVLMAYMLTGQYNQPLQFSWTDKLVIYQLGLVIFLFLAWRSVLGRRMTENSAFILICAVLGQWYIVPAIGKLRIGWLSENKLANLVASAWHQNGWLSWLSADALGQVLQLIDFSNLFLLLGGMCTEFAVICFLVSRRLTFVLLAMCAILHISIFATSGIFFWKWVVFELALIAGLSRIPLASCPIVFGWRQGLLTCGIMGALAFTSDRVVNLAWYDEPYAYRFRFQATGISGSQYELIAADFAPYDLPFAQARFYFLTERKQLVGTFGTTQTEEIHYFFQRPWRAQVDDIDRVVENLGQLRANGPKAQEMQEFLARFIRAANDKVASGRSTADILGFLVAPHHIHTAQRADASLPRFYRQERLRKVDVFLEERLLDDARASLVFEEHVLQVTSEATTQ